MTYIEQMFIKSLVLQDFKHFYSTSSPVILANKVPKSIYNKY